LEYFLVLVAQVGEDEVEEGEYCNNLEENGGCFEVAGQILDGCIVTALEKEHTANTLKSGGIITITSYCRPY